MACWEGRVAGKDVGQAYGLRGHGRLDRKEVEDMVQKPAVHIELREDAWIVVREGNQRATSVHPTQTEAAESGRELARRDGTEFFLHGQDGQIREHRDYREGQTTGDEGVLAPRWGPSAPWPTPQMGSPPPQPGPLAPRQGKKQKPRRPANVSRLPAPVARQERQAFWLERSRAGRAKKGMRTTRCTTSTGRG